MAKKKPYYNEFEGQSHSEEYEWDDNDENGYPDNQFDWMENNFDRGGTGHGDESYSDADNGL